MHQYWLDLPAWRLWKAQLYQESKLDPSVCSQVGACGLAQFMPASWDDAVRRLQWDKSASRFDARLAIEAGAFYQAQLRSSWKPTGRSALDRNDLGQASYNAGFGNILKAQTACKGAVLWPDIAPCMASVTGEQHARETQGYVTNIHKWWKLMETTR